MEDKTVELLQEIAEQQRQTNKLLSELNASILKLQNRLRSGEIAALSSAVAQATANANVASTLSSSQIHAHQLSLVSGTSTPVALITTQHNANNASNENSNSPLLAASNNGVGKETTSSPLSPISGHFHTLSHAHYPQHTTQHPSMAHAHNLLQNHTLQLTPNHTLSLGAQGDISLLPSIQAHMTSLNQSHVSSVKKDVKPLTSAQKRTIRKWAHSDGYKDYQKVTTQEGFSQYYSSLADKFISEIQGTEHANEEWDMDAIRHQLITYRRSLHTAQARGQKRKSLTDSEEHVHVMNHAHIMHSDDMEHHEDGRQDDDGQDEHNHNLEDDSNDPNDQEHDESDEVRDQSHEQEHDDQDLNHDQHQVHVQVQGHQHPHLDENVVQDEDQSQVRTSLVPLPSGFAKSQKRAKIDHPKH